MDIALDTSFPYENEVKVLFERLVPKLRVNTVFDIDLEELFRQGYRGIITDLDNTLVGAKAPLATPELLLWFTKVKELGFKLIIVSNNNMDRVSRFATPLNIEFVHQARKPSNAPFLKAMKLMDLEAGADGGGRRPDAYRCIRRQPARPVYGARAADLRQR